MYHPKFGGSYSIKAVLPALAPEMTYEGMEVAHGAQAGVAWEQMVRGGVGAVQVGYRVPYRHPAL